MSIGDRISYAVQRKPIDRRLHGFAVRAALTVVLYVLSPAMAGAQLALPHDALGTTLSAGVDAVFTIDLGTLSERPIIVMEAVPDGAHLDMEIEIELTNFVGLECAPGGPFGEFSTPLLPDSSFLSDPGIGAKTFEFSLIACNPGAASYAGESVDVRVRALDFGAGGGPATADISIKSRTLPPFNELLTPATGPRTVILDSVTGIKDTTIYEDDTTASNGNGQFIWAGSTSTHELRRGLIAFDFTGIFPTDLTVNNVDLVLEANTVLDAGGVVSLYEIDRDPLNPWVEGTGFGLGDEFDGGASGVPAATWTYRQSSTVPWVSPGGDLLYPELDSQLVTAPGSVTFSSPDLASTVEDMIITDEDEDGFLLKGPIPGPAADEGVQFRSSEAGTSRPEMLVTFTPTTPSSSGEFFAGTLSFINEGQNLRWIYDLDGDDIYETPIQGVCEVDTTGDLDVQLPYTYQYNGTPGFVGHDCCTWQIDSNQTGLVGTGQAIFFHNLDAANPANFPPDTDSDGIRDLCDNCPFTANGPLLGSCVDGPTPGAFCINDGECGTGGTCDQSQADDDLDFTGNACPEPGFAMLLGSGALALCVSGRRQRR